jgi:hypothetical protein
LPSQSWTVNRGWMLATNLAGDIEAWARLLGLHDRDDLADAEPDTLRYRLWHLPARLVRHARRRILKIPDTWPWRDGVHHLLATPHRPARRTHLNFLNPPAEQERRNPHHLRRRGTRTQPQRHATTPPSHEGTKGVK